MNTPDDKTLHRLFAQNTTPTLPEDFNRKIMRQVYKIQKRKERLNLLLATLTSVIMLGIGTGAISYYLTGSVTGILKKPESIELPGLSIYLFFCIIVTLLLWIDYKLRKRLLPK